MKSTSTAEAISAQLLALLPQHPAEATVHSVFHTSANLLYQGQLVTLLDDTRPLYPCAVRLGGSIPSIAAGEPALLSRERITFPHSGHTIELHRAAVTSLSLFSPLLPLQLPPPGGSAGPAGDHPFQRQAGRLRSSVYYFGGRPLSPAR